ncbi:MAG: hypothetical protein A2233_04945 [Candidatus Kerfeldbacteria bacterium RIFOXYA2_FULL_38_24]|uniref:Uncharacterized protein n=1 Tax=Candidatus Kerfeldbacteria bacterium RIFOXYB2_FULL_38_14 TaxID=1798547 RepID=A0A1G2B973_9BACT|nr:MAG: hypothetical protein A2233_04945 [Candidatus Kerfeldbacteria bacterium RIFOXYA2_FULL_38_24]OGY85672.1 MAG: hypothetical protein A2319_05215 [Candidatus Kerfeldbacteria bacterium RIFOXYB2_FULL_38_14]OGY88358.1 MAG: hypothetical protein A2458_02750 [Candidatus Kerfeldbacteria bacterium RIFOXYC2_FULL_38_9]
MIPDPKKIHLPADALILDILSKKPRLSVKDLYEFFIARYKKSMSLQAFYNLIHRLVEDRVLIKEGKLISIDGAWIYNLLNFAHTLQENHFGQEASTATILLNEGESKSFILNSPVAMDNFWWHALIIVILYYDTKPHHDKNAYVYIDHCWFQLLRTASESALNDAYRQHNIQLYHVGGSNNFLDHLTPNLIDDKNVHIKIQPIKDFPKNYYNIVIGDFIFETKMPPHIYEQMETIYATIHSLQEFDSQKMLDIVQQSAQTILIITRDKKKAESIRKKIRSIFTSI